MEREHCQVRSWALVWKVNGVITGTFRLTPKDAVERWVTARLSGHNDIYIGRMSDAWVRQVAYVWSSSLPPLFWWACSNSG